MPITTDSETMTKGGSWLLEASSPNGVFTPDDATVKHARKILNAFAEADTGLVVVDGKLIEKPVLREMQRVISISEKVFRAT